MNTRQTEPRTSRRSTRSPRSSRLVAIVGALLGIGVIALLIAIIVSAQSSPTASDDTGGPQVLRSDTHVLDTAEDDKVELVEFLDFECEACGALYPFVEQLRAEYDGRITFAVRYFPLDGHRNSENAALAAEAAAEQGEFEAMYSKLFDTQSQWGGQQESRAGLFRSYAEELGLDMAAYDQAVAAPATEERVQRDFDEGLALGVQGTPTFFLNGEKLQPETPQEFVDAIDAALAE